MGTSVLAELLPAQRDELELDCDAACVGLARRWATERPATRMLPVDLDAVRGVVSELVTNAVLHARSKPIVLTVFEAGGSLYVAVSDGCPERLPCPRTASCTENGGRGLQLVNAESSEWGWEVDNINGLKHVWAKL